MFADRQKEIQRVAKSLRRWGFFLVTRRAQAEKNSVQKQRSWVIARGSAALFVAGTMYHQNNGGGGHHEIRATLCCCCRRDGGAVRRVGGGAAISRQAGHH